MIEMPTFKKTMIAIHYCWPKFAEEFIKNLIQTIEVYVINCNCQLVIEVLN